MSIKIIKKPQSVVYFQIVGTHNTANEVFHAVHFESPAQPETESRRPGFPPIGAEGQIPEPEEIIEDAEDDDDSASDPR